MIPIYETFSSIQGEGNFQGHPAIFIRVAGCNLRCEGFGCKYEVNGETRYGCDTFYSVDPDMWKGKVQELKTKEEVIKFLEILLFGVVNLASKPIIVLTGGEPLIYQKDENFKYMIDYLTQKDYIINIETNGSISPIWWLRDEYNIHFSVSVKLQSAGGEKSKRIIPDAISKFNKTEQSIYKFVVSKKEDLEEILGLIVEYKIPWGKIWLMPLGETKEKIIENYSFVMQTCFENDFKFSSRLHLLGAIK